MRTQNGRGSADNDKNSIARLKIRDSRPEWFKVDDLLLACGFRQLGHVAWIKVIQYWIIKTVIINYQIGNYSLSLS